MENKIQSTFYSQRDSNNSSAFPGLLLRIQALKKLKKWVLKNRKNISHAVYKDLQRHETETEITETFVVLQEINFAMAELENWMQPKKTRSSITFLGTTSFVLTEPKGVCLIISPWNYPFQLATGALVSALAAGNRVILKPSELTPHTSALIHKMCAELFNENEVSVLEGDKAVVSHLLQLPFDHILFIGSPAVGRIVMEAAAKKLTSITLELGGKSPVIISPETDLKDAANKISSGKFLNCGQSCVAPDYALVHESIAVDFTKAIVSETKRKFGNSEYSFEKAASYGRMVNAAHVMRIKNYVNDAVAKGAKIELGGRGDERKNFMEPTILTGITSGSLIMQEEIFGPVLPIITFKTLTEVLALFKNKHKPLNLYVFSTNKEFVNAVLTHTVSGNVCINDCNIQFMQTALPFGGVGESGMGKTHGYAGFLSFSNSKSVLKQHVGFTMAKFLYPPFTSIKKRLADLLIKFF